MSLIKWVLDILASEDVVDSYFIETSLVDIRQTDAELYQQRVYDALCQDAAKRGRDRSDVPIGKRVL